MSYKIFTRKTNGHFFLVFFLKKGYFTCKSTETALIEGPLTCFLAHQVTLGPLKKKKKKKKRNEKKKKKKKTRTKTTIFLRLNSFEHSVKISSQGAI